MRVAAVLLLVATLSALAPSSSGHDTLAAASPGPGAQVDHAPREIQLQFVLPAVADPRNDVQVRDGAGHLVTTGPVDVDDLGLQRSLTRAAADGWFSVSYRVVLWGGHLDEGTFRYRVRADEDAGALQTWHWPLGLLLVAALTATAVRVRARLGPRAAAG